MSMGEQEAAGGSAKPAEDAPQGGQDAMIRSMVGRLAARLTENGADLDGWLRLIRSYAVLKETGKAQEAVASARKQFASDPEALKKIDAMAGEAGQAPAGDNAKAPAAEAPASGQAAMIRGMVDRLATRLKENGADLDGWLRLIRSYAVLNETGKAQEAAASARKQFASEPEALTRIETLTGELGIPAVDGKGEQPKLMTRKQRRAILIAGGLATIGISPDARDGRGACNQQSPRNASRRSSTAPRCHGGPA